LADSGTGRDTPDSLDAWVLATAPEAVAYAFSLLRDRAAAEDVVQDCYYRLIRRAAVYDLPRDGRKLLFASITRACINHATRTRSLLSLDDVGGGDGLHERLADRSAAPPEQALRLEELQRAVAEGLSLLPVSQRAALEMKSLGHSVKDIAAALGVNANYVGVLIHRARRALADHLAPFLEDKAG
jgi:RNA polymerase sigma-70 factor (ECF subfamily)